MKQKILITKTFYPDLVERLRGYFDVTVNEGEKYSPEQLHDALVGVSGVLVAGGDKINAAVVSGLPALRAVCVSAAGYNNIDVPAMTHAGVIVTNSPGPADETVADFAWGTLISIARKVGEAERWVLGGNWKASAGTRWFGTDVHGKTLGIVGMGRIGQAIARRAAGFRVKLLYHNRRRLAEAIETEYGAVYQTLNDLLAGSDFVILSLPYAPGNHHIIGAVELRLMRSSAYLINIARGGLIDEPSLADALQAGRIAGAALDVFEEEPVIFPGLKGLPNVLLTPHIAGATQEAQYGLAELATDNLIAALGCGPDAGRPPAILNPEVVGGEARDAGR